MLKELSGIDTGCSGQSSIPKRCEDVRVVVLGDLRGLSQPQGLYNSFWIAFLDDDNRSPGVNGWILILEGFSSLGEFIILCVLAESWMLLLEFWMMTAGYQVICKMGRVLQPRGLEEGNCSV